jgi:hypothetical protein
VANAAAGSSTKTALAVNSKVAPTGRRRSLPMIRPARPSTSPAANTGPGT